MSNYSHYGAANPAFKHGHAVGDKATPEYVAWCNMRKRCNDPTWWAYQFYGGRGIRVASGWEASFSSFLNDVGPRPSEAHSLDRFPDVNGNYEPGNVRWATAKTQARNRRSNHLLTFRGETKCIAEWSDITGLDQVMIVKRIRRGWAPERALTEPSKPRLRGARYRQTK